MQQTVFIGAGAGFAGDRTDAAGPVAEALARSDGPRFLIFETLAERTLALAQVERRRDPARGYNPLLEAFVGPVLRTCLENKIRIVKDVAKDLLNLLFQFIHFHHALLNCVALDAGSIKHCNGCQILKSSSHTVRPS